MYYMSGVYSDWHTAYLHIGRGTTLQLLCKGFFSENFQTPLLKKIKVISNQNNISLKYVYKIVY